MAQANEGADRREGCPEIFVERRPRSRTEVREGRHVDRQRRDRGSQNSRRDDIRDAAHDDRASALQSVTRDPAYFPGGDLDETLDHNPILLQDVTAL